jgi:hypothetical protein
LGLDNWGSKGAMSLVPIKGQDFGFYFIGHEHGFPMIQTFHWSHWSYGDNSQENGSVGYSNLDPDIGSWTRQAIDYSHWPYGGV